MNHVRVNDPQHEAFKIILNLKIFYFSSNQKKKVKSEDLTNSSHLSSLHNISQENSNSNGETNPNESFDENENVQNIQNLKEANTSSQTELPTSLSSSSSSSSSSSQITNNAKKRSFNVDSLLAPDLSCPVKKLKASTGEQRYDSDPSYKISIDTKLDGLLNDTKNVSPVSSSSNGKINENGKSKSQSDTEKLLNNEEIHSNKDLNDPLNQNVIKSPSHVKHSPRPSTQAIPINLNNKNLTTNTSHKGHGSSVNAKHTTEHNHHNHSNHSHNQYHQNSPFSKLESDNADVENWKLTFSKIMARSYKNTNNNSNQILNSSSSVSSKKS